MMTANTVWMVLLILFGAAEAITVGLTSIWFALGALGALICSALGGAVWLQLTIFLAVSFLTLALVRPLSKKYLSPRYSPTNADRVIGKSAMVTQTIDNLQGVGQVSVAGQSWTARSRTGEVIPADTRVRVLAIEGVKVFVAPETGDKAEQKEE